MTPAPFTLPDEPNLMVIPWDDPVVDSIGYDAASQYVELFWLNVLGPTATWILRRLAIGFDRYPLGYEVDLGDLAGSLGLTYYPGSMGPFLRAMQRCVMFGVSQPTPGALAVRRRVPPVAARHLMRMPASLRRTHEDWRTTRINLDDLERARTLAVAMLAAGDPPERLERQLLAVGVPPRVAATTCAATCPPPDAA